MFHFSTPREWNVHIKFDKNEIGTSFRVKVYLAETYVGSVDAYVGDDGYGYGSSSRTLIEGFVHLTEIVLDKYPELSSSLEPREVRPILIRDLSLNVEGRKRDNTPINIGRDLRSLKAAVYSQTTVQEPDGNHPWIPGETEYDFDILRGKPGHCPAGRWAD